jgi:hypothetical protein
VKGRLSGGGVNEREEGKGKDTGGEKRKYSTIYMFLKNKFEKGRGRGIRINGGDVFKVHHAHVWSCLH